MLASGGEPHQLTHDEGDKEVDSFSPDDTEIYYGRVSGRDEEWAVPTLGALHAGRPPVGTWCPLPMAIHSST